MVLPAEGNQPQVERPSEGGLKSLADAAGRPDGRPAASAWAPIFCDRLPLTERSA